MSVNLALTQMREKQPGSLFPDISNSKIGDRFEFGCGFGDHVQLSVFIERFIAK